MCNVLSNNEFQYNRIRWWTLVFKEQVLKINYVTIVYSHLIESSFKAFLCNDHEMLTYKVLLQSVSLWFSPIKQLVARPSVSSKHISSFFIDFPALFHVLVFFSGNPPAEYSAFLQHTFNVFKVGLDRELYRHEQELTVCIIITAFQYKHKIV